MAERAAADLAELLQQIQGHRIRAEGELQSVDPAQRAMGQIARQDIPAVERTLFQARALADAAAPSADPAARTEAVSTAARQQAMIVKQLAALLAGMNRSAVTGASLHRAEQILADQLKLNVEAKVSLRDGFGKTLADLPDALRRRLLAHAEEQLRIGRQLVLLDGELAEAEKTGPPRQQSGIKAARRIIAEHNLRVLTETASGQFSSNDAAAATGGEQLAAQFRLIVDALRAATAGAEFIGAFDLLGPSLAELAARDKELAALLDRLRKLIREAELMRRPPEREELRRLQNMQQELNAMLVEINRNMPDMTDAALLARLKEMLLTALAAMERAGQGLDRGQAEAALEELRVTLSNLVLAEEELKALLASLAALQAAGKGGDENARETPAGIALGLGLRLSGNQTGASGPGGVLNPNRQARELGPSDWGHLPPALRNQIIEAVKESYPPEYADLIELYFQNIAKGASGRRD
jgi:hypothetical protein